MGKNPTDHKIGGYAGRNAALIVVLALGVYLGGYAIIRQTHAKQWFDKTTEETGSYTFFDSWSKADVCLCIAYRPALIFDSILTGRTWLLDK